MDTARFKILTLVEDPARYEEIVVAQQNDAAPAVQRLLEWMYLEKNRARAFARFNAGFEFRTIRKILDIFGVRSDAAIVEIGGGPGFLAWALTQTGYANVALLEPNGEYVTGTGYLRSREDSAALRIHNDLAAWHEGPESYDVVITKNCIHHFPNIAQAAASIRQKLRPGARWFAFREQFADTPQELYGMFADHPYCQPHGLYEWSYPASHYVEAIEMVGFSLKAIVPAAYANHTLASYQEDQGDAEIQRLTTKIDSRLADNPGRTVEAFWDEVFRNRHKQAGERFYSRPQLMVFDVKPV